MHLIIHFGWVYTPHFIKSWDSRHIIYFDKNKTIELTFKQGF